MKNLIAELLLKLAEKEEESKELVVQVEALEIVVTALLRKLEPEQLKDITSGIEVAMSPVAHQEASSDAILLRNYVEKLLNHPRI
ncbi:MAG: anti-adapter protein IraP [Pantoea sp.]|uniref:anti-adapter protein IraP n=1 Tax=unclassified Pantoea TaxID=2630326 RepID=UPI0023A143C3|nr:anti-adapter protein IraP [Pantoea sp.]MDE1189431.1 anti-adapter protein IraP [Pantoea sp.]